MADHAYICLGTCAPCAGAVARVFDMCKALCCCCCCYCFVVVVVMIIIAVADLEFFCVFSLWLLQCFGSIVVVVVDVDELIARW